MDDETWEENFMDKLTQQVAVTTEKNVMWMKIISPSPKIKNYGNTIIRDIQMFFR